MAELGPWFLVCRPLKKRVFSGARFRVSVRSSPIFSAILYKPPCSLRTKVFDDSTKWDKACTEAALFLGDEMGPKKGLNRFIYII